jgi:hypothetical protein
MPNTYTQLPGALNLSFRRSDQFGTQIDFDVDMTGVSVVSSIVSAVTGSVVMPLTTTIDNAATGKIGISLTESQTSALPVGTYNWRMIVTQTGDVQRTYLTGIVEVRS